MKWKLYLLCFLLGFKALAQIQTSLIKASITMPTTMPANVQDWATTMPPVIIQASATPNADKRIPGEVAYAQVLVTINSADGKKVCGIYTPNTAPEAGISSLVKIYKGADIERLLGQTCTLQPGDYQLCVQFYFIKGEVNRISEQVCKQFSVKGKAEEMKFTGPQLISPANGKLLSETEQKQPINFRWTPILPRPREEVNYKVTVVEIRKGQSASEARIASNALLETTVKNQTQMLTRGNISSVAPIAKDSQFGWYVQAFGSEGNLMGTSEMGVFSEDSPCSPTYKSENVKAECGKDGKVHVTGNIVITPKTSIKINQISLTDIRELNYSGANVTTSISIFPKILTANGNSYAFDFIINSNFCDKDLYVGYKINYYCELNGKTKDEDCVINPTVKIPCCKCTTCDQVNWTLPTVIKRDSTITNNLLSLSGNISFGPQKIVKLSTEIVDFYWYTEGDCKKNNNNGYYFGNLASGSITGFTSTNVAEENGIPLTNSRQIDFVSSTLNGLTLNGNINLNISLPPQTQLSCCTDCFRFCIRYTATFMENGVCKTCSIVKCYETKRKHRPVGYQLYYPINQCGDPIRIDHGDFTPAQDLTPIKN